MLTRDDIPAAPFWPTLAARDRRPEVMDDPELDPQLHRAALRGLARINTVTRSHAFIYKPLRDACRERQLTSASVLDFGCGSGDLLLWLRRRAERDGIDLRITGCDLSDFAVQTARERATRADIDADFVQADVLHGELPRDHDFAVCSLFLHHFSEEDAVTLLARMRESAAVGLILSDLKRSRFGHLLAWCGTRVISRSPVVHYDGPLSVEAAVTEEELRSLALRAGLPNVHVRSRFPARLVLTACQS